METKTKKSVERGALIVIEGPNGAGDTLYAINLEYGLRVTKGSDGRPIRSDYSCSMGQLLRNYFHSDIPKQNDQAWQLLLAANRWELRDEMVSQLERGVTIVLEHYVYGNIARSVAHDFELEWCKNLYSGLPRPDIVIYLNGESPESDKRRVEEEIFHSKVIEAYDVLKHDDSVWVTVDASRGRDEIHKDIMKHALSVISEVKKGASLDVIKF